MPRSACLIVLLSVLTFSTNSGGHPSDPVDVRVGATSGTQTNQVSITVEGSRRIIVSNGIPDHRTGRFPNRDNPNQIRAQDYYFETDSQPKGTGAPTSFGLEFLFGVAINGVPFDPAAAEWWRNDPRSGWRYEAMGGGVDLGLDSSNAHVQPTGAYHYHGIPNELMMKLAPGRREMVLLGWAADGFPIYGPFGYRDPDDPSSGLVEMRSSYRVKSGRRPGGPTGNHDGSMVEDFEYLEGSGDLDECNGRFGVTPEFPEGIWHYYLTNDFPYIPRAFHGHPDDSFRKAPGNNQRGGRERRGMPGGPGGPFPPGGRGPEGMPPLGPPPRR